MATDDETLARLKTLAERLERLRQQAREVHNLAADQVRTAHLNTRQRKALNEIQRRPLKRSGF